jgi:pterin-4a-carbinolamine dehydratase
MSKKTNLECLEVEEIRGVPRPGGGVPDGVAPAPEGDPEDLKSERVQEPLMASVVHERISHERLQAWLLGRPGWQMAGSGKAIQRVKVFPASEIAAQYSAFVTGYAGALGLPVAVNVLCGQVEVTLHARREHGRVVPLTEAVLVLAEQIG